MTILIPQYTMLHTMIRVQDLDKSITFYDDAFGLKGIRCKEMYDYHFILVFLGNDKSDFQIELTYNYDPIPNFDLGTGYGHLALGVKDLEESHAKHQSAGYEVGPLKGFDGKPHYYFITDPDGYKIEVIQQ